MIGVKLGLRQSFNKLPLFIFRSFLLHFTHWNFAILQNLAANKIEISNP